MYITQTLHYPIALTPTLVRSTPEIASSLSNLGFFAGEFLIILFTFSATLYFYQLRFALIALLVATALRNWLLILNNETPETHTDIAIVQPAIRAESFFAASNNLYQRRKIEKSLDNLTYSAASQNAQLIVWPEAANGLPNFNLPNRVKTTRNILSQTKSELLITGYEYNSAGKKFNTAYLISSDSAIQRAQKKITVPLIESNLARGREKTFESKIGRIGVAICFEGLFNSQFKNLAEQQADYFFVLTDDSSMRNSNIPSIHTSYAILFSKIYKKPLVFSNNNSVSFTSNSLGEVTSIDREGNIPKVNYWKLSTKKTDASWIIFNQEAVIAFISALVLVCARNV
ncbi:apolipoprotein N-acyltransferase [Pseudomonas aeruginosa]|nr:apolipoprotein N-acyltransferase [Pseudomonas aeruginosa]